MYDPERVALGKAHGIVLLGLGLAAVALLVVESSRPSSGGGFVAISDRAATLIAATALGIGWIVYAVITSIVALLVCRTRRAIAWLHVVAVVVYPAALYGLARLHG